MYASKHIDNSSLFHGNQALQPKATVCYILLLNFTSRGYIKSSQAKPALCPGLLMAPINCAFLWFTAIGRQVQFLERLYM